MQYVDTYFARHHNTSTQFITTIPIVELCMVAVRLPGRAGFEALVLTGGN